MAISISPKPPYLPFYSSLPSSFSLTLPLKPKSWSLKLLCCLSLEHQQPNEQIPTTQNDATDTLRVVFAAGGTGGHIYPAVAIADELKITNPNVQILFLGTPDSMESAGIPSTGYAFAPVPASPLARPFISPRNLLLPIRLIKSLIQSHRKLSEFDPHIVVGTGGYVSFPICLAAWLKGIKVVIQEQNSVPGIANWILSFLAEVVFVAFNSTIDCFPRKNKCVVCGNPVRMALRHYVPKAAARLRFFPKSGKEGDLKGKVLLVLGGSLGANAINIAMLNLYYQMLLQNNNLFIIWQTGVESYNEMESLVKTHPHLYLTPFMHSMDLAYAAADLIISRAGAMTCYEILATGKPSILEMRAKWQICLRGL
ncbi:hypothetical protein RGQ29_003411 [Quercus rubra]|uniref:Uncharacterized protein n=1 Tax=Quercus rubra TaxID=3512 RepID=A0AAN7EBX6_QUERU|nr:hypothetical protein RGQ29_003411 [Quercus rubra]